MFSSISISPSLKFNLLSLLLLKHLIILPIIQYKQQNKYTRDKESPTLLSQGIDKNLYSQSILHHSGSNKIHRAIIAKRKQIDTLLTFLFPICTILLNLEFGIVEGSSRYMSC